MKVILTDWRLLNGCICKILRHTKKLHHKKEKRKKPEATLFDIFFIISFDFCL